jgi:PAS domain S-box-containing protein
MKKKILIVDDSMAILHLLDTFLQKEGYEVATAEDGLMALDVMERFKPDIMFIDFIMPIIRGDKLCRIIRKMPEFNGTSLVIISATAAEENIDFLSLGADACIAKGPLKAMLANFTKVLGHLEKNETEKLTQKIYGKENIFERDITRELLATQKHLEITLDNMEDGLIEITGSGKITFVNRSAAQMFSLPEEKLLSAYFADFFTGVQQQLVAEQLEKWDGPITRIGEKESIVLHNNYLYIKFIPFQDQGRNFFIILIQDITKRKLAEMQLKKNEEELEKKVKERTAALEESNNKLQVALDKVKLLSGMLPICSSCKKIRDDKGYWNQIDEYIRDHSEVEFTHSICEECARKLYPEFNLSKDGWRLEGKEKN